MNVRPEIGFLCRYKVARHFKTNRVNALINAHSEPVKVNYSEYVKVSNRIEANVFNYLHQIRPTVVNFVKAHGLEVKFNAVSNRKNRINIIINKNVSKNIAVQNVVNDDLISPPITNFSYPEKQLVLSKTMKAEMNDENEPLSRKVYRVLEQAINK